MPSWGGRRRPLARLVREGLDHRDGPAVGELAGEHELEAALHADEDRPVAGLWITRDALPWAWRRLRGRTAGAGLAAKHDAYVEIPAGGSATSRQDVR